MVAATCLQPTGNLTTLCQGGSKLGRLLLPSCCLVTRQQLGSNNLPSLLPPWHKVVIRFPVGCKVVSRLTIVHSS